MSRICPFVIKLYVILLLKMVVRVIFFDADGKICYNTPMSDIVDIYDISYEGAGVGRINNQIVFVPKTLKNEKVRVKVTKRLSSFLLGEVDEVLVPSQERIEAKCMHYHQCGGCDFQHCGQDEERRIKTEIIRKEMAKAGYAGEIGFEDCQSRFSYRNKLKLEYVGGKLGFFKPKSRDLFEVCRCEIASDKMNELLPIVKDFIADNELRGLQSVYFKQVDESFAVCFLFPKEFEKILKKVQHLDCFDGITVYFAFGDVLESNSTKLYNVYGNSKLVKNLGDLQVAVDVSAFNQVNDEMAEKLYAYIESFCERKRVVNAYSGQGLLTYRLSKKAKFVYGIEYQISAHQSAERLCSFCDGFKMENICGRVEEELKLVLLKDRIDLIVLDPAREGCDRQVLESIVKGRLEEIVYVSCNFATLVRDLKFLKDFYDIQTVKIFNMFPCCVNMETVAVLKRKT